MKPPFDEIVEGRFSLLEANTNPQLCNRQQSHVILQRLCPYF